MSDDILSGGAIDPSTDGPVPSNTDDRLRNVLEEQRIQQEQEAIGGSQFPIRSEPLPPIDAPIQVSPPPLPEFNFPSFEADISAAFDGTREIARQAAVDVLKRVTIDGQSPVIEGSSISFNTSQRSIASEDFGTGGNSNFLKPAYSTGRLDSPDFGSAKGFSDNSSSEAYARAEARRDAERMAAPDFDIMSSERQRGESRKDFKERQEKIEEIRKEKEEREKIIEKVREGDMSEVPSGYLPVSFSRADKKKKVLAFIATEFVGVVDQASGGERETELPSKSSYYEAGGEGGSCFGLGLYVKTPDSEDAPQEVWVGAGMIANQIPSGFSETDGKNISNGGSGYVWGEVNIDQETGEIVSVAVDGGGETPEDSDTAFYYTLGYYEYNEDSPTVTNYGCGSLDVVICRNWYAAEAPFYGVTINRCGCGGGGGGDSNNS
jgi:hypothetical protein